MTTLKIGDKCPSFEGINQNEETLSKDSLLGKKYILFFYPRDNTPGCTAEACNLSDNYEMWQEKGYEIIGVSPDTVKKHQNFIKKYNFPYDLIADTEHNVLNAFGVWGEKKFMGRVYDGVHRTTFVIDEKGIITQVFQKVKTKTHSEQILESL